MTTAKRNQTSDRRGGAPVGLLEELEPVEAGAVLYLRQWCDGADAQTQAKRDFSRALGPDRGKSAVEALDQLCMLCATYGRRPLMRHHLSCRCLGADESCFANFVAAAASGEREDALMIATLMVRVDMAPCLVAFAERLGHALHVVALKAQADGDLRRTKVATIH